MIRPSAASLSLPDLIQMAHLRRSAGAHLLACMTFMAAATLARQAGMIDLETALLDHAWWCHEQVMKAAA